MRVVRMSQLAVPDPSLINENTPLRLDQAVAVAFPQGGMTVSGLRREAKRGRLVIERVAGKDFVTLAAIEKMRKKCRVQAREPGSGSAPNGAMTPTSGQLSGSSVTETTKKALAVALVTIEGLRKRSPDISPRNTPPSEPAAVIPLRSRSPMP
jgi:hypothetical protein